MIYKISQPKKPSFRKVYKVANEFLVCSEYISAFPYKLGPVISEMSDITLCSYSKARNKFAFDPGLVASESASLVESNGRYVIFYNDSEPKTRQRYSIMHEYAHYVFKHKMDLLEEDPLYGIQEVEANSFAAQVLMPEQIIRKWQGQGINITTTLLIEKFGVSEEAAKKRIGTLSKNIHEWNERVVKEYDDIIIEKYSDLIYSVIPEGRLAYDFEQELSSQAMRDSWMSDRR